MCGLEMNFEYSDFFRMPSAKKDAIPSLSRATFQIAVLSTRKEQARVTPGVALS